jgi:Protein of unknown function (DUF2778)
MWTYETSSGNLTHNGNFIGVGYSGNTSGLNNPAEENIHDVGPIPRGAWTIGAFFDDPEGKGPLVAHLTPNPGTNDFARSGFMIHCDNAALNHTASEGCIILAHPYRQQIADSGDTDLQIV